MAGVVQEGEPGQKFENSDFFEDLSSSVPPCGTAACIHGWTALLKGKTPNQALKLSFAWSERQLGLNRDQGEATLFYAAVWPEPFASQYRESWTPAQRAKVAAARIEHLITTGE